MIIATIIGMAIVTMIPRFIPAFIMDKIQFRPWVNQWLNAIPFAALGALIFPGIMTVIPERPLIGLAGGAVAVVIALFNVNVIFAVLGAILTVFLITM
ncbi:branched-chain amino acid transporter [Halalkalibacillus sediminis]|uniref:Branched-chain amino acid transporter n=1 Tax=Halalkalibacillus sediminis TaxID=2018042 RepID=A0A2I0QV80_9BACI|nr:AzlD domain-containing protein [Halalkalibacillus sediminis]PKR78251.1 branched-chain amino acid transporter [Halalkalibacillus sediminis]